MVTLGVNVNSESLGPQFHSMATLAPLPRRPRTHLGHRIRLHCGGGLEISFYFLPQLPHIHKQVVEMRIGQVPLGSELRLLERERGKERGRIYSERTLHLLFYYVTTYKYNTVIWILLRSY